MWTGFCPSYTGRRCPSTLRWRVLQIPNRQPKQRVPGRPGFRATSSIHIPSVCDKLIHISAECGLTQLQRQPTRQNWLLDLFFMSNKSSIDTIPSISTASDHDAIVVDTNLRAQCAKASPQKVHLWSKAQWPTIKEETSAFVTHFCAESLNKPVDE